MAEQTKVTCLLCGREWPGDFRVCPRDGMFLASDGPSPEEFEPGATLGEYKIIRKLGAGGMATVYAACHGLIGKNVAIKILSRTLMSNREAVGRFLQEARSVSLIGHKNIVEIHGYGTLPDGRCYLVMELLEGQTLGEAMETSPPSLLATLDVLDQICDALEAAHAKNVIHRDLKPDNILLLDGEDGGRRSAKLLDFGLAKLAPLEEGANLTRTGVAMGTPEYLSPEQARGFQVDDRSDVYSLGVMLFEMLFGRLPFKADNAADMLAKHLLEEPPSPREMWPDVPERLETLLTSMLSKTPAERPSATAVRIELRALLVELELSDVLPPLPSKPIIRAPEVDLDGDTRDLPLLGGEPLELDVVAPPAIAHARTELLETSDATAIVRLSRWQRVRRHRWVPVAALGAAGAAIALTIGAGERPANEAEAAAPTQAELVSPPLVNEEPIVAPEEPRADVAPEDEEPAAEPATPAPTTARPAVKKPPEKGDGRPVRSGKRRGQDDWRLLDPWEQ